MSTSEKYYWIKKSFLKQCQTKSCDPLVMKRYSPDYVFQFLSFSHATCRRLPIFEEAVPQGTPHFSFCSECNSVVCKRKSDLSKKKHVDGCTCTSLNSQVVVVVYQWKGVLFDGCPTSSSSSLYSNRQKESSSSSNRSSFLVLVLVPRILVMVVVLVLSLILVVPSSSESDPPSSCCCSSLLETTTRTTTDNSTTTTTTTTTTITIEMEEEKAAAGTAAAAAGTTAAAAAAAGGRREGNNSVSSLSFDVEYEPE